ncbi:response regulator transcription factor [Sedimenticola thiotaurini]|uniref:Response regulator n=1 Tax=Sedimenticola thiotaurini TaxID=1543721 RepID=A0A0F7JWX9_9GAMM|nr:response regulator transcription factor [Sedimenticola thiotaurini]AKH20112.1 response regulator [Sedimenticola thiotaurini]
MSRKIRLLIVEDEPAIRTGLVDLFVFHGYQVECAEDGREGLRLALSGRYDLLLLDVMLPGVNGFDICAQVREQDREQPIIMLTAKSADEDVIQGLSLGADDYVAKPFSVAQLVLRVQAVLRRARVSGEVENRIRLGDTVELDCRNLSGRCGDQEHAFTRREMELLQYLHANAERPVSRDELLTRVWGYARNLDLETRTVDIHIAKLRRKIEPDATNPRYLVTVRGAGYRLLVE